MFRIDVYTKRGLDQQLLSEAANVLNTHGWTYDQVSPGGYTNTKEGGWVFEDQVGGAGGREQAIRTIVNIGTGAILLSKEIEGKIRSVNLVLNTYIRNQIQEEVSLVSVTTTTDGYIYADQDVASDFAQICAEMASELEAVVAFAGPEYRVPGPTDTIEHLTGTLSHIAPVTYFGPQLIERLGEEKIRSLPTGITQLVSQGTLLIACREYMSGCSPDCLNEISNYLDLEFYSEM